MPAIQVRSMDIFSFGASDCGKIYKSKMGGQYAVMTGEFLILRLQVSFARWNNETANETHKLNQLTNGPSLQKTATWEHATIASFNISREKITRDGRTNAQLAGTRVV